MSSLVGVTSAHDPLMYLIEGHRIQCCSFRRAALQLCEDLRYEFCCTRRSIPCGRRSLQETYRRAYFHDIVERLEAFRIRAAPPQREKIELISAGPSSLQCGAVFQPSCWSRKQAESSCTHHNTCIVFSEWPAQEQPLIPDECSVPA